MELTPDHLESCSAPACSAPTGGRCSRPGSTRKRRRRPRTAGCADSSSRTRDPICRVCGDALSTEVDHVVPLSQGGDPYRLEGLQGICSPCHWVNTGEENAGVS